MAEAPSIGVARLPPARQLLFPAEQYVSRQSKHRRPWQVWPDKASFYAAEEKLHQDGRLDGSGEPPFDARRLILGCFEPLFSMGRD